MADNDDMGGNFSSEMLEVAAVMPPDLNIETGSLGVDGTDGLRDRLVDALDRGVGLVDWMGHGGLDRLAEEGILVSSDVAGLHGPALRTDLSGLPSAVVFADGFESGDTSRWDR